MSLTSKTKKTVVGDPSVAQISQSVHTLSVWSFGSKLSRRPFVRVVIILWLSGRLSLISLTSLSKMSLAASWSDLHRERAPVRLVVLVLTTAAARLTVSSDTWMRVGVGDRLSDPHEPQELVSLSSRVGRLPILGECCEAALRPNICAWIWSQMRLNRRKGPERWAVRTSSRSVHSYLRSMWKLCNKWWVCQSYCQDCRWLCWCRPEV